ncbi:hypothetical protein QYF36_001335 [Acer negundo]|nr:hypothetical protein QYF36_001335 [Acer negundo]
MLRLKEKGTGGINIVVGLLPEHNEISWWNRCGSDDQDGSGSALASIAPLGRRGSSNPIDGEIRNAVRGCLAAEQAPEGEGESGELLLAWM